MFTYIAILKDIQQRLVEVIFHANNNTDATTIANQITLQSKCGLASILKIETILEQVAVPEPESNIYAKGICFYYYEAGAIKDLIKFAVPSPKFVDSGNPEITTEPFTISLIGKVATEEGNLSTSFSRAKYTFRHPNY